MSGRGRHVATRGRGTTPFLGWIQAGRFLSKEVLPEPRRCRSRDALLDSTRIAPARTGNPQRVSMSPLPQVARRAQQGTGGGIMKFHISAEDVQFANRD